jgi:hypothetical protein
VNGCPKHDFRILEPSVTQIRVHCSYEPARCRSSRTSISDSSFVIGAPRYRETSQTVALCKMHSLLLSRLVPNSFRIHVATASDSSDIVSSWAICFARSRRLSFRARLMVVDGNFPGNLYGRQLHIVLLKILEADRAVIQDHLGKDPRPIDPEVLRR